MKTRSFLLMIILCSFSVLNCYADFIELPCDEMGDDTTYYYQKGEGKSYHKQDQAYMAAFNNAIIALSNRINNNNLSGIEVVCRTFALDTLGHINSNVLIRVRKDQQKQDTIQENSNAEQPLKNDPEMSDKQMMHMLFQMSGHIKQLKKDSTVHQ